MLLLLSLLFLLGTLLSAITAYGIRPRPGAPQQPWPWWAWASAIAAGLLMLVVIPVAALLSAP